MKQRSCYYANVRPDGQDKWVCHAEGFATAAGARLAGKLQLVKRGTPGQARVMYMGSQLGGVATVHLDTLDEIRAALEMSGFL